MNAKRSLCTHLMAVFVLLLSVYAFNISILKTIPLATHDENRSLLDVFAHHSNEYPQPLQATLANMTSVHGPLYFILLNLWSALTGNDLLTLRMLSLLFCLLAIAMAYRLGRITRDGRVALAAAFMLSLNCLVLYFARELRMYTLVPFISGWLVWSYWRVASAQGKASAALWLSLIASTSLLLYAHYFGIFILASIGLYHLLMVRKTRRWFRIVAAMLLGGLLFLPWLPRVIAALGGYTSRTHSDIGAFDAAVAILTVFSNDLWPVPIACLLLIIWKRRQLDKAQQFILIVSCLCFAMLLITNEFKPILWSRRLRYLLVFAPLPVCSLAIGWKLLPKRPTLHMLMIAAWLLSFTTYSLNDQSYAATKRKSLETRHAPPFYALVYYLGPDVQPDEVILSLHSSRSITYISITYYQQFLNPASIVHLYFDSQGSLTIQTTRKQLASLDEFVANYDTFWLLFDPQDIERIEMEQVFNWAVKFYRSCGKSVDERDIIVERFVRDSDPC